MTNMEPTKDQTKGANQNQNGRRPKTNLEPTTDTNGTCAIHTNEDIGSTRVPHLPCVFNFVQILLIFLMLLSSSIIELKRPMHRQLKSGRAKIVPFKETRSVIPSGGGTYWLMTSTSKVENTGEWSLVTISSVQPVEKK